MPSQEEDVSQRIREFPGRLQGLLARAIAFAVLQAERFVLWFYYILATTGELKAVMREQTLLVAERKALEAVREQVESARLAMNAQILAVREQLADLPDLELDKDLHKYKDQLIDTLGTDLRRTLQTLESLRNENILLRRKLATTGKEPPAPAPPSFITANPVDRARDFGLPIGPTCMLAALHGLAKTEPELIEAASRIKLTLTGEGFKDGEASATLRELEGRSLKTAEGGYHVERLPSTKGRTYIALLPDGPAGEEDTGGAGA